MTKPATRPATAAEPTLAEMAAKARTSSDHATLKVRLINRLASEKRQLADLKGQREQAALTGTTADLVRQMTEARDEIEGLEIAIEAAEQRRDEAETREINEAMLAGAKAAHIMAPQAVAIWKEYFAWLTAGAGIKARLEAKLDEIDQLQAHARRKHEQGERRDLIISRARIRGDAAALCLRPILGASAASPMSERDNIYVAGRMAVEQILELAVHENPFDARRSAVLVNLNPTPDAAGRTTIDPSSTAGRPAGGFGRGVA